MKYKSFVIWLGLLILGAASVQAGSELKIGTSGGAELLIPVGSRGTSMGGSVVANSFGIEAIYWNPAGLATLEGTEAMFSHQPWLADIDVNFAGVGTTIEGFGTLGVSAKVVSIGKMEQTTEAEPEGTGKIYEPTMTVIGVTYARSLTANVNFGVTGMLINERIFEVSANGMAFDFGVTYDPRWHGMTLGIVLKNYGPDMRFKGPGFERTYEEAGQRQVASEGASFQIPSYFSIGLAYNFYEKEMHSATLTGDFRANNFQEDFWQGGFEYAYNDRYFVRAGYNYSTQGDWIHGAALGLGLNLPFGENKLSFEYSWNQTDVFDDSQFFTVKADF